MTTAMMSTKKIRRMRSAALMKSAMKRLGVFIAGAIRPLLICKFKFEMFFNLLVVLNR